MKEEKAKKRNLINKKSKLKSNEKLIKKEQGITLIALVVTIIILLILAGVAINMALGDNGLFKRSKEAVNAWKSAEENETGILDYLDSEWDNLVGGGNAGSNGPTLVDMYKKAIADDCTDGKTCTHPGEHVHVGDYVTNYNNTLKNASTTVTLGEEETGVVGTQTYSVDTTTTWRVAGLSQDGKQLIITTGSPIKKSGGTGFTDEQMTDNTGGKEAAQSDPYLYLFGAEGWYNTNDKLTKDNPDETLRKDNILDKISKIYDSRYSAKTASMRMEDILTLVGVTVEKNGADTKAYNTGDASKTALSNFQHFFGQTYTYENGDYAPENYLKEKYPENARYQALETQGVDDTVEGSAYALMVTPEGSKINEILFKDTTASPYSKSYWLASAGAYFRGSYCSFGPGAVFGGLAYAGCDGFFSGGLGFVFWFGVRPVVYLQSNVTTKELSISVNGTEEEWTTVLPNNYRGQSLGYGKIGTGGGLE